jgi:hypothetical protein
MLDIRALPTMLIPEGSANCGDECVNRLLKIECDPRTCPNRDACTNRRLQLRDYPELQIIMVRFLLLVVLGSFLSVNWLVRRQIEVMAFVLNAM